jgi:hypothetical protein
MSINAPVHCHLDQLILGGLCRHVLPRNASVVWAGLTKVASSFSSSSSFHMTAKTSENTLFRPGSVFYVSKRSKLSKKRFYIRNPFFKQGCVRALHASLTCP